MNVELRVLGPLAVRTQDATMTVRGALKCRLVARLALTPDRVVGTEALMDAMWADDLPRTARQSLHVHVSHLRETLRGIGAEGLIGTADRGYVLGIDPTSVDACQFPALVEEAGESQRRGDLRGAHDCLVDALELWGDPFVDLADHPAAAAERQRLIAVHEHAEDDLNEARLAMGDTSAAITSLRAVLAEPPLRDRPYQQLMRAHLDRGETTEALAVFDRASSDLSHSLGVQPSAELVALTGSIREQRAAPLPRSGPLVEELWAAMDEPGGGALVLLPGGVDLRETVADIRNRAATALRPFAHARVPDTDLAPLSPLMEMAGLTLDAPQSNRAERRREVFNMITSGIEARLGIGALLVIDGVERAPGALVDYFASVIGRSTPPPFTVLLVARNPGGAVPRLSEICNHTVTPAADVDPIVELGDVKGLGQHARDVLWTLELATRPAPTELVIRASGLRTREAVAAISQLSARNLVSPEPGGRLDLALPVEDDPDSRHADEIRGRHDDLARALGRVLPATDSYRVVAEAKHRLAALPLGEEALAWKAAAAAANHLDSLGAYHEIRALAGLASERAIPTDGPGSGEHMLEVLVLLGRAEIRTGHTGEGRITLQRAIDQARAIDSAVLFAEAVRAMAEERAPQVSDQATRALEVEALERLADHPSDTRVQLTTDLANSFYLEDPDRADELAQEALTLAHRGDSGATIARALTGLIQARIRPDNAAERLELALEAQEHARRSDSTESLILALTYEASALMEQGNLRRAAPPLRYAEALAADVQVPRFRWWAAAWRALLAFALGENPDPEAHFRAAYEMWPSSTRTDAFECFASQVTAHRLLQGRGGEIVDLVLETSAGSVTPAYRGPAALAQAQAGDLDGAATTLAPLFEPGGLADLGDATLPTALATATEAAHLCGLTETAGFLLDLLEPLSSVHAVLNMWGGGGFYWGSLSHALGLAQDLGGDTDLAQASLSRAARDMSDAGALPFARRSQEAAGRVGTRAP